MTTPDPTTAPPVTGGVLRLEGRDVLPVLHRIGTHALLDLAPGAARGTLFCDFRGRLLHRALVARAADGSVWLARDDADGASLAAYVDRHVFREDVRISDRSGELVVSAAWDEAAPERCEERDGVPTAARAARGPTLRLAPGGARGAADPPPAARARVEHGWPAHGHEISEAFHPFEVNLADEIHLDKGCFTGQEVLQRLVTYGSVRRRLVRVTGAGPVPVTPSDLVHAGERCGVVTTAMPLADSAGGWSGLAVLRVDLVGATGIAHAGGLAVERVEKLPLARPHGRPWAIED